MTTVGSSKPECVSLRWDEAHDLPGTALVPPLFRHPTIAAGSGHLYLVGNNVPTLLRPVNPYGRLAIWSPERGLIAPPDGRFTFVNPQAIVDARGKLQVVWGEARASDALGDSVLWPAINVGSIWTASFDTARGWSSPRRVYTDSESIVLWDAALADRIFFDTARRAVIAVPTLNPNAEQTLILLFDGEAWRTVHAPIKAATASALTRDDTLIVAYLAAAEGSPRDANSVFVVRSPDAGRSWVSAQLVWRSGIRPAQSLRMRMTADGALHLLWEQQDSSGVAVIRHFVQYRGAAEWTSLQHLVLTGGFNALDVAADACGRIHVVFENYPRMGADGALTFATWSDSWSKPTNLFGPSRPMDPALSALPDGRLVLTMLARLGPDPMNPRYQQLWAEGR